MKHNRDLQIIFNKLTVSQLLQVRAKVADAPKLLQLVQILESNQYNENFAINRIYKDEIAADEMTAVRNRFFKLRAKLLELLDSISNSEFNPISEEEERYKELVVQSYDIASMSFVLGEFLKLEEQCWKKNQFELLVPLLSQIIRLKTRLRMRWGDDEYKKLEIANKLNFEVTNCYLTSLQCGLYVSHHENFDKVGDLINYLRQLAHKYKEYPRFSFIYHWAALNYKLFAYHGSKQELFKKHYHTLKNIFDTNPEVPLFFDGRYKTEQFNESLLFFNGLYYFNIGDLNESENQINKLIDLYNTGTPLSRTFLANGNIELIIMLKTIRNKEKDVAKVIALYEKTFGLADAIHKSNLAVFKSLAYFLSSTQNFSKNAKELIPSLREAVSFYKEINHFRFSFSLEALAMLLFINGNKTEVEEIFDKTSDFKKHMDPTIYNELEIFHTAFLSDNNAQIAYLEYIQKRIIKEEGQGFFWLKLKVIANIISYYERINLKLSK
ncbi:MAG: hypothetical protein J0M08_03500 [Bacteroidetes bacterium]|nr:hypothetical protein [Bacteroidota bacterium]